MTRYVGSGDYYTINCSISATADNVDAKFPTAPMYKNKESYSGRCRIWLKSYVMGAEDVRIVGRDALLYPCVVLAGNCQNNYNSVMGELTNAQASARQVSDGWANAEWNVVPTFCPMDANDRRQTVSGGSVGTFGNILASATLPSGIKDGTTQTLVTTEFIADTGQNSLGARTNDFLFYEEKVFHPATAYVIGAPWGNYVNVSMRNKSCIDTGLSDGTFHQAEGRIFISFVVEPLINEHIPNHMEMSDEKSRVRY
jgi:hypothetical protein|tara:strand:- start:3374 stop:4138 length:765 start_codon:yes stop_codon:yes gene_type:complete